MDTIERSLGQDTEWTQHFESQKTGFQIYRAPSSATLPNYLFNCGGPSEFGRKPSNLWTPFCIIY